MVKLRTLCENRSPSCRQASSAIFLLGMVASFKDTAITEGWFHEYLVGKSGGFHLALSKNV